MGYENISRVSVTELDGNLKTVISSTQPEVLILGTSTGGKNFAKFTVNSVGVFEKEFGGTTSLARGVHEAISQGASRVSVMRVGGAPGSVVLEESGGGTLTVSTWYGGDNILDRYALVLDNDRYLVYDLIEEAWVYDSSEILVIDEGEIVIETSSWPDDVTIGDIYDLTTLTALSDLVVGDFTPTLADVTITAGSKSTGLSHPEYYAALANAYHYLSFEDADFIVPMDAWADAPNIADASPTTYGQYWAGVPAAGGTRDKLGYVWHAIQDAALYTYMTDTADYFSVARAQASIVANGITLTAAAGKGGNACTFEIADAGVGQATEVTVTENTNGGVDVLLEFDFAATVARSAAKTAIDNALLAFTMSTGKLASALVTCTVSAGNLTGSASAKANFTGGTGGHALTHFDLTGIAIPSAVSTLFAADDTANSNSALRETNYAHQLAVFCHVASQNWKDLFGMISVAKPTAMSRAQVASWVGELPDFTDDGTQLYIDGSGDNGTGLLGNKFWAGKYGYRTDALTNPSGSEGIAFGGFILTKGTGLHTADTLAYGVLDTDEALDANGRPIDIGSRLWISYDWVIHTNTYNNGTPYRGDIAAARAGLLSITPENVLPIASFGKLAKVNSPLNIHPVQVNALNRCRLAGIFKDNTYGLTISSAETAANPNSDYTLVTTRRCVNAVARGIRRIGNAYRGKPYTDEVVASLQAAIDGFLLATKGQNGLHQGALARVLVSRTSRVLGNLQISLRMVPPFSIKYVDVTVSLAGDESEL